MTIPFLIIALLIVGGSAAAMGLRNPVHCVLALTLSFAGIAALYLELGAQFVGFTQIMVYVGAVAILAVFAIMMTHRPGDTERTIFSRHALLGILTAAAVFAVIGWAVLKQPATLDTASNPGVSVQQIGTSLMHEYVLPLEIIGLLLTAALIGAVVIAMDRKEDDAK
jgi:NADH:ubiquinone oxidoreductase subunit 6 (subunit J)